MEQRNRGEHGQCGANDHDNACWGNSITGPATGNAIVDVATINTTTLTLTGNGSGTQVFVINVSGSVTLTNVVLAGGVTANQVLFNITGTGSVTLGGGQRGYGLRYLPRHVNVVRWHLHAGYPERGSYRRGH